MEEGSAGAGALGGEVMDELYSVCFGVLTIGGGISMSFMRRVVLGEAGDVLSGYLFGKDVMEEDNRLSWCTLTAGS